ncbi:MAG: ASCH domain-containing protein [Chloroflexota bacterium]|nr:ASCH domain-containing protein [Chloroflexota bacterium]
MADALRRAEFGFPRTDLRRSLVEAILRGEKTSTTGLLSDYERDGDALPEVGERFVLIDEQDAAVGIIEMTEVRVTTIGAVDLPFAVDEGEGFTSVQDWREAHERFWLSYADVTRAWLKDPDWHPTDDTPIVCERFRLVASS